jgi:GT2 family glycosyltransferase
LKPTLDLSVIIVNYNVRYFLEQCILSVLAASKNLNVEIIVVDNCSSDDSCKILQNNFPEVILIQNKENVGFSKANNQGAAIAKGNYVLILNPDTVVGEDTFEKILKYADKKTNFGILGVKLIDGKGDFLPESKRGIPTPMVSFNKLFGISSKKTGKYYAAHLLENETGVVDVLVGAFMLLKRDVYNEVNGFDEDYFMYGEDIDLSYKVLNKGYSNYYFADTQVIHYKGESTKKDIKYLKYFHSAMKIFYKKHFQLNKIYDLTMNVGIEFWFLLKYFKFKFNNQEKDKTDKVEFFNENEFIQFCSDRRFLIINNENLNLLNPKRAFNSKNINAIVFDNNSLNNKTIIDQMEILKDEGASFKIRPRNTNFIIGS